MRWVINLVWNGRTFMIRLIPHKWSWRRASLTPLVGTDLIRCGPVSQPVRKEIQRGLIGEPFQPEDLKGDLLLRSKWR